VEVAKVLGGSFKLVTLAPKTVREMTQLPRDPVYNISHVKKPLRHIAVFKVFSFVDLSMADINFCKI